MSRSTEKLSEARAELVKCGPKLLARGPDEDYGVDINDAGRFLKSRALAYEQAEMLHRLAELVKFTGIPLSGESLGFGFDAYQFGEDDDDVQRQVARRIARFGRYAIGAFFPDADINKVSTEWEWGIRAQIGPRFHLEATYPNQVTCKNVELTDDEGEPIMEEVKVPHTEYKTEMRAKTERQCITLFGNG